MAIRPTAANLSRVTCRLYNRFYKSNKSLFAKNAVDYWAAARQYVEPILRRFTQTGLDPLEAEKKLLKRFEEENTHLFKKDQQEYQKAGKIYVEKRFREWVSGKDNLDDLINSDKKKSADKGDGKKSWLRRFLFVKST